MKKFPVALQVYSVRENAEANFFETLKEIKELGYDGVELAGLYDYEPEQVKAYLDQVGLKAVSAHVPYLEWVEDMEGTLKKYITIGCKYVAVPYLTEEYRPGTELFPEVVATIRKIGELCRSKDVVLLYHNHDFEFVRMEDGRYALDYLYETVPSALLQTEIDTCWVKVSGEDPAAYIKKYAGRCPVVHLKDFSGGAAGCAEEEGSEKKEQMSFEFRAVGNGCQDFPSILEAAEEAGAEWVVVEQDSHHENTAMEDARISREYLRTLGI